MATIDYKMKQVKSNSDKGSSSIQVSHVTIRQSIFFLHLRLVLLEGLAAIGLILFLSLVFSPEVKETIGDGVIVFNVPFFLLIVLAKILVTIYVIVSWLNRYYEINPTEITDKKGLIFVNEKRFLLEHIGAIDVEQGIFGRIFNFGTLKLFNWATEKEEFLYQIHNPLKYYAVLKNLLPEADKGKSLLRENL